MEIGVELGEIALLFFKFFMGDEFSIASVPESGATYMVGVTMAEDNFSGLLVAYGLL